MFRTWSIRRQARRAARQEPPERQAEYVVQRRLGPRPSFDPVNNFADRQLAEAANLGPEIEEVESDLRAVDATLGQETNPWGLRAQVGFFLLVEVVGSVLVLRDAGVAAAERVILGATLGLFVFFLTWMCARHGARRGANGRRSPSFYLVMLAYAALVLAVTTIRASAPADEEHASRAYEIARALVLMFATIGPAWLAEDRLRRLAAVAPGWRARRRLALRFADLGRQQRRANDALQHLGIRMHRWDRDATRLGAGKLAGHPTLGVRPPHAPQENEQ